MSHLLSPGPDGRITVADGGRLAFEYLYTNTANAAYSSLVYDKDIHIAGHGPDGEGALYHANSLANNVWFSTLGRVTLDADASIGGNARIDFRRLCMAMPDNEVFRRYLKTVLNKAGREIPADLKDAAEFEFPLERDCVFVLFAGGRGAAFRSAGYGRSPSAWLCLSPVPWSRVTL